LAVHDGNGRRIKSTSRSGGRPNANQRLASRHAEVLGTEHDVNSSGRVRLVQQAVEMRKKIAGGQQRALFKLFQA
jgi:hypothetical protein